MFGLVTLVVSIGAWLLFWPVPVFSNLSENFRVSENCRISENCRVSLLSRIGTFGICDKLNAILQFFCGASGSVLYIYISALFVLTLTAQPKQQTWSIFITVRWYIKVKHISLLGKEIYLPTFLCVRRTWWCDYYYYYHIVLRMYFLKITNNGTFKNAWAALWAMYRKGSASITAYLIIIICQSHWRFPGLINKSTMTRVVIPSYLNVRGTLGL